MELNKGDKVLDVSKVFEDGDVLRDAYSNQEIIVSEGKVNVNSEFDIVLLEK